MKKKESEHMKQGPATERPGEHSRHHHAGHHHDPVHPSDHEGGSNFRLAVSATVHCLLGCGIGEVAGMIIATALLLEMIQSTILAVILGFIAGMSLGVRPLLRSGFSLVQGLKTVIVAEGLSIAVMEGFEVLTQAAIPGVMEAGLTDGIFWVGMSASLVVGFVAALPVNYVMIRRGIRHIH